VTAAPAMGEHDDRRFAMIAGEVPHGQLRSVRRPDDGVLGPHALAPTKRQAAVVRLRVAGPSCRNAFEGHTGKTGRRQGASDEQQAGPAPADTTRR